MQALTIIRTSGPPRRPTVNTEPFEGLSSIRFADIRSQSARRKNGVCRSTLRDYTGVIASALSYHKGALPTGHPSQSHPIIVPTMTIPMMLRGLRLANIAGALAICSDLYLLMGRVPSSRLQCSQTTAVS